MILIQSVHNIIVLYNMSLAFFNHLAVIITILLQSGLFKINISLAVNLKAIHNKDYSVVKTFSASSIYGAFLFPKRFT